MISKISNDIKTSCRYHRGLLVAVTAVTPISIILSQVIR
jgi:hypothetical protein